MPIYAYRCEECGFAKDALQKISDAPLSDCPSCGKSTFKKQLTAAGFQLKGTGWYVTDFRGNGSAAGKPAAGTSAPAVTAGESGAATPAAAASTSTSTTPAAPAASSSEAGSSKP